MSNLTIKQLESLLLADDQETVLKNMPPKSQDVEYLRLVQAVQAGDEPWAQLESRMKSFEPIDNFDLQLTRKIEALRLIKSVENAKDQTQRKAALAAMNEEWFYQNFDYHKPDQLELAELDDDEEDPLESRCGQVRDSLRKAISEFEADPNDNFEKVKDIYIFPKVDFAKITGLETTNLWFLDELSWFLRDNSAKIPKLANFRGFFDRVMRLPRDKIARQLDNIHKMFKVLPLDWIRAYLKHPDWRNSEQLYYAVIRKVTNNAFWHPDHFDLDSYQKAKAALAGVDVPPKMKAHLVSIHFKVLQKLADKDDFREPLFVEYLDNAPASLMADDSLRHDEQMRQKFTELKRRADQEEFEEGLDIYDGSHAEVVDKYLKHFLARDPSTARWERYFDSEYLRRLFVETQLLQGKQPAGFEDVFTAEELDELTRKKELTLITTNKQSFSAGEAVTFLVRLKNVETLRIKVFQINLQQMLKENPDYHRAYTLNDNLDLQGLLPKEEYVHHYQKPPLESWVESFSFESIQSEPRGMFVVDFIAGSKRSRAIVKKGRLILLAEPHKLGTVCVILDEEHNVCTGDRTGLHIKGTFHKADRHGKVYLPHNDEDLTGEAVVCHGSFATVCDVEVKKPEINLTLDVIFNREQLRPGHTVDLVLCARMNLFEKEPLELANLEQPKVEVEFGLEGGIAKTLVFDDQNGNALRFGKSVSKLSVPFPPKTTSMTVSLSGKVTLFGKDALSLHKSQTFKFTGPSNKAFTDIFVSYDSERGYIASVKGLNGEPVPNSSFAVDFELPGKYNDNVRWDNVNAKTDRTGKCVLGKFDELMDLEFNIWNQTILTTRRRDKTYFYSEYVFLVENEDLAIPVASKRDCSVLAGLNENIDINDGEQLVADITDQQSQVRFEDGMLILSNLEPRKYYVSVGPERDQSITIQVLKGKRVEVLGKHYAVSKDNASKLAKNNHFWRLVEDPSRGLRIARGYITADGKRLSGSHTVEGLALCSNYIYEEGTKIGHSRTATIPKFLNSKNINSERNEYFNEESIADEIMYVQQRKQQTEYIGNTLQKPSMLLARHEVKKTVVDDEKLKKNKKKRQRDDCLLSHPCALMCGRGHGYGGDDYQEPRINTGLDFLQTPGTLITDGLLSDNAERLTLPQEHASAYNHVQAIVILGGEVVLTKTLPSQFKEPATRSLALAEPKKQGFVYRHVNSARCVRAGQAVQVEDAERTQFRLVKSVADLARVLSALNPSVWRRLSDWRFALTWQQLSPAQKLTRYDEFASHELNLLVKFKDADFFEQVVRPHLKSKLNKSLVDHFLLDDARAMQEYLSLGAFDKLAFMDKVLVLLCCRQDERAAVLAQGLALDVELPANRKSEEDVAKAFDVIIRTTQEDADGPGGLDAGAVDGSAVEERKQEDQYFGFDNYQNSESEEMEEDCDEIDDFSHRKKLQSVQDEIEADEDANFRKAADEVYRKAETTAEYAEKQFHFSDPGLTVSPFYLRLVQHALQSGACSEFLDADFIHCAGSATEMLFLLAVLDLPFEDRPPSRAMKSSALTLTCESNCVVFSKRIHEAQGRPADADLLVLQKFYDPADRYRDLDDGTKAQKPVRAYRRGKAYGCQVVVTNCTASTQKVTVTTEVPQGSIPVTRADTLVPVGVTIESFRSEVVEFEFYFPCDGSFGVYPCTVAKGDSILAMAQPGAVFEVGKRLPPAEMHSIADALSSGRTEDVLEFLRTKNIRNPGVFEFDSIGWLVLKSERVWRDVLAVYRSRGVYDKNLWAFGFKFGDVDAVREYMRHSPPDHDFRYLQTSLLRADSWEAKDYFPLINPRTHSMGDKTGILNREFKDTYRQALEYLLEKRTFGELTLDDRLLWVTYLVLQDRIREASRMFASISPGNAPETTAPETLIQKDYLEAYLDFATGYPEFARSRELCQKYLSYPVLTWRNLFVEIANQLAEHDNVDFELDAQADSTGARTRAQRADESPFLEAKLVDGAVRVNFKNQDRVHVEFYRIDLEVLFSKEPFRDALGSSLTNVLPFLTETHELARSADFSSETLAIPANLRKQNLLIRVVDDSQQPRVLKYIPFRLRASLSERYGVLKVAEPATGKPVPKVYVKCFCRTKAGQVEFYKDGYTDLRGSFDYVAVSAKNADTAESFRILVISEEFGAKIFSAKPPVSSVGRGGTVKKLRSANWRALSRKNAGKGLYSEAVSKI